MVSLRSDAQAHAQELHTQPMQHTAGEVRSKIEQRGVEKKDVLLALKVIVPTSPELQDVKRPKPRSQVALPKAWRMCDAVMADLWYVPGTVGYVLHVVDLFQRWSEAWLLPERPSGQEVADAFEKI